MTDIKFNARLLIVILCIVFNTIQLTGKDFGILFSIV